MKKIKNVLIALLNKKGFMRTAYHYANKQYGKYEQYSLIGKSENDVEFVVTNIRILSHEIEKGFSLPSPRKGFGKSKLQRLDKLLGIYEEKYRNYDDQAYSNAINSVCYYISQAQEYDLDISFLNHKRYSRIKDISDECGIVKVSVNEFCNECKSPFDKFVVTRHSIRNFNNKAIQEEEILKVIKSAQSAPSACNRQSVKVFHVKGEERCKGILDIQGGSKGFSQVNDVLIVASDLSLYTNALEVNTCYVDSGLFAMNLLLALHYYKIGSCPLLWNDETERGEQLRKIVSIPEKYEIALVIPIGYYPEEVKYSVSKRKEVFEVYERV